MQSQISSAFRRALSSAPLLLPLLILAPHAGFVPFWDGSVYAGCIQTMVNNPSWARLVCAGHATHGYIGLMALAAQLRPGNAMLLLAGHALSLVAALWAFRRVLERLFPEHDAWGERTLLVATLAAQPVMLASTLNPNPDVVAASLMLLVLERLLARRAAHAALFGALAVFTKEIALLLLGATVASYALAFVLRESGTRAQKLREVARLWPMALPFLLFGGRLAFLALSGKSQLLTTPPDKPSGAASIAAEFLSFDLLDGTFLSYSAGILVQSFQWLQTLAIAALCVAILLRSSLGEPWYEDDNKAAAIQRPSLRLTLLLFVTYFVVLTRYRTYSSPRYWVAVYPMMLMLAYVALRHLKLAARWRTAALGLFFLGSFSSIHATSDPVSRMVYGTFSFGRHEMLKATSITSFPMDRLNSGYGRDQLVYNLQFAHINDLQSAILAAVGPSTALPFLVDDATRWNMWDGVDVATGRRTMSLDSPRVPVMLVAEAMNTPPPRAIYVRYPVFEEVQALCVALLDHCFDVTSRQSVEVSGYEAEVLNLSLNEPRCRAWHAARADAEAPVRCPGVRR